MSLFDLGIEHIQTKKCKGCKKDLPLEAFRYKKYGNTFKPYTYCVKCEKHQQNVLRSLRKSAGRHNSVCECCGRITQQLNLDHCHDSENHRGWICSECNIGIAKLGDNYEGVKKALDYLRKYERHISWDFYLDTE